MPALNFEPLAESPEPSPDAYPRNELTCAACGAKWESWDQDSDGPLKCPKCGHISRVSIRGIYPLRAGDLGKSLGKCSWCDGCQRLTLNAPGKTHNGKPLARELPRMLGKPLHGDIGGWPIITAENVAALFFGCAECGQEKFWVYSYRCPRCDSEAHAILEMAEPKNNRAAAIVSGGHPVDWEELWICLICGRRYWIHNANY